MTTYHFEDILVRVDTGGDLRAAANMAVTVVDPVTGLTPAGLQQDGMSVSFVTSSERGVLEFTAEVGIVNASAPAVGFERTMIAIELYGGTVPGVTDHGNLTGLADDDHTLYAKVADAVPLATATPLGGVQNGYAGTDAAAAHGLHRHPLPSLRPSILYRTTEWLTPQQVSGNTGQPTLNDLWLTPYWLCVKDNRPIIIASIGVYVAGAGSVDSTIDVGLYAAAADGLPDFTQLLVGHNALATGNTTGEKSWDVSPDVTLPASPILCWAGTICHGTTAPSFSAVNKAFNQPRVPNIESGAMTGDPNGFRRASQSVLPTTAVGLSGITNDSCPAVFIKLA